MNRNTLFPLLLLKWQYEIAINKINGKNRLHNLQKRRMLYRLASNNRIDYFIETGTSIGDTCYYLRRAARNIISIEYDTATAKMAASRFKSQKNISIIHGDSRDVLPKVLNGVKGRLMFWLDGHKNEYSESTAEVVPLLKELDAIANCESDEYIIAVDDIDYLDKKRGYPNHQVFVDKYMGLVDQYVKRGNIIIGARGICI